MSTTMSLAETYVLASKVRGKLTRDASNPKASLRSLVVQANMLDSLMDHIADESEKRVAQSKVTFSVPSTARPHYSTSVTEYEVDDDSDSDSDSDYDVDSDSDLDSDSTIPVHYNHHYGRRHVEEEEEEEEGEMFEYDSDSDSEEYDSDSEDDYNDEPPEFHSFSLDYKHILPVIEEESSNGFDLHRDESTADFSQLVPRGFSLDELELSLISNKLFQSHHKTAIGDLR